MKDKQRLAKAIIGKMIDYCDNIQELMDTFDNSYDRYVSEIAFQYSCNMCVLQIGELAARLSDEVKVEYPQIPWRKIC